jgi:hypothetical protein
VSEGAFMSTKERLPPNRAIRERSEFFQPLSYRTSA